MQRRGSGTMIKGDGGTIGLRIHEPSLPPVANCRGTKPSQAARSRPRSKLSARPTAATRADATIAPNPGMVASRRASSLSFAQRTNSVSKAASTPGRRCFVRVRTDWSAVVADGARARVSLMPVPDKTMNPFGIRAPCFAPSIARIGTPRAARQAPSQFKLTHYQSERLTSASASASAGDAPSKANLSTTAVIFAAEKTFSVKPTSSILWLARPDGTSPPDRGHG
jgi:hypothetical protein